MSTNSTNSIQRRIWLELDAPGGDRLPLSLVLPWLAQCAQDAGRDARLVLARVRRLAAGGAVDVALVRQAAGQLRADLRRDAAQSERNAVADATAAWRSQWGHGRGYAGPARAWLSGEHLAGRESEARAAGGKHRDTRPETIEALAAGGAPCVRCSAGQLASCKPRRTRRGKRGGRNRRR